MVWLFELGCPSYVGLSTTRTNKHFVDVINEGTKIVVDNERIERSQTS